MSACNVIETHFVCPPQKSPRGPVHVANILHNSRSEISFPQTTRIRIILRPYYSIIYKFLKFRINFSNEINII